MKPVSLSHVAALDVEHGCYRADIDGLRAIAVFVVVICHYWPRVLPGGFSGVDVFFVISGHVITRLIHAELAGGEFRITAFWARRLRRLLPSLLLVVATVLSLAWLSEPDSEYRLLGRSAAAALTFSSNILFYLTEGYFEPASADNMLLHTWSLGAEMEFYLIWPILLTASFGRRWSFAFLTGVGIVSFLINVWCLRADPPADFYLLPARLWEMSVGGLLALAAGAGCRVPYATFIGMGGFALIIGSALLLDGGLAYPGVWALAPVAGALAIIMAGSASWLNRIVLSAVPVVYLGRISYQLYLWHWPLLVVLRQYGVDEHPLALGAMLVLGTGLSGATEAFVERPFRRRARPDEWLGRHRIGVLSGVAAALLIAGLLAPGIRLDASRPPRWVDEIAGYQFDHAREYRQRVCFLDADQGAEAFAEFCTQPSPSLQPAVHRASVLLWGDSHAAHLYPGLRDAADHVQFDLLQLTASGCPPILDVVIAPRPRCAEIVQHAIATITRIRPDTVILAANWRFYSARPGWPDISPERLGPTCAWLRSVGVQRIIVVGPVPNWRPTLPDVLIAWQKRTGARLLPARLPEQQPDPFAAEPTLLRVADQQQAAYLSPRSVLCDAAGCLVTISGPSPVALTAWDAAHLTTAGSRLLGGPLAAMAWH